MDVRWSTASLERTIHLTGKLAQLYERLQRGSEVERTEMVQAVQHLEELKKLAVVPGATQMHQKYHSLLHPYLHSYGLTSAEKPPAWDQNMAMRQAFNVFQESLHKSRVVNFVHHLYQVVQHLRDGTSVSKDSVDSILSQLDEMDEAVHQLADEYPQLPGQFARGIQRLRTALGELGDQGVSLANDYALRNEHAKALTLYKRAYDYYLAAQDLDGQGIALLGQAQAFQGLEQPAEAEAAYPQAQYCFQTAGAGNRECQLVYAWGNFCLQQSRFQRARDLYSQGIQLAEAEGDEARQAEGHRRLGNAWANEGRFDQAITSYQTSISIAQAAGDDAEERHTWVSLGHLYVALQRPVNAIHCYEEALALIDDQTFPEERAALLFHLNMAHQSLGQYREARELWKQAMALAEEMGHADFLKLICSSEPKE